MKKVSCKSFYPDCDWEYVGNSEEEVIDKALEHGREKHKLTDVNEDLKNKIRDSISEVKAA